MKRFIALFLVFALMLTLIPGASFAGSEDPGDDTPDLRMIAQYLFNQSAANSAPFTELGNAELLGTAEYVQDESRGWVANLPGGANGTAAIQLPAGMLAGLENVTITGWFNRGSSNNTAYERYWEFGKDTANNFCLTPNNTNNVNEAHGGDGGPLNFSARITNGGSAEEYAAGSTVRSPRDEWAHLAVTFNKAAGTLSLYQNGLLIDSVTVPETVSLANLVGTDAANNNFIGRTGLYGNNDIDAMVSDFRVYNDALPPLDILAIANDGAVDLDVIATNDINGIITGFGDITNVIDDISLPKTMPTSSVVTYTSSLPDVVNPDTGVVTRPPNTFDGEGATVTLGITLTVGTVTKSQNVTLFVPRLPTDIELATEDIESLDVPTGLVVKNFLVPTTAPNDSVITWTSSAPEWISAAGFVTRPLKGAGNKEVTLTATAVYGTATVTKEFPLIAMEHKGDLVLVGLPEIEVITPVGMYPRLPYYIPGIYANGEEGPLVRVSWTQREGDDYHPLKQTRDSTDPYKEVGAVVEVPGVVFSDDAIVSDNTANVPANKRATPKFTTKAAVTVVDSVENYVRADSDGLDIVIARGSADYGRKVSANFTISNSNPDQVKNVNILLATYDAEGRLFDVNIQPKAVDDGSEFYYELFSPIDTNTSGFTFKAFVWDENMAPLVEGLILDNRLTLSPTYVPTLRLEKFHYSQIKLNRATEPGGPADQFFINDENMSAAQTRSVPEVNSFLYMFRQTFGIEQPAGATPLRSWDSDATKLRGHATGHHLSALSQVYATRFYDPEERARALTRINDIVDNLYMMSLMSKGDPRDVPSTLSANGMAEPDKPYDPTAENADTVEGYAGTKYDGTRWKTYYTITGSGDANHAGKVRMDIDKWGEGYISAYPPDQFSMVEKRSGYSGNATATTGLWAPYYTLHKILTGLTDCYEMLQYDAPETARKALDTATGMALWVQRRFTDPMLGSGTSVTGALLNPTVAKELRPQAELDNMWSRYIAGEYGGMNEVMSRIAMFADDPEVNARVIEGAKLFDNRYYFYGRESVDDVAVEGDSGLANNIDTIGDYDTLNESKHSNQHIPQILGVLRMYDDLNEEKYFQTANNFWDMAINGYAYSTGGVCGDSRNGERFHQYQDAFTLSSHATSLTQRSVSGAGLALTPRGGNGSESCATYNLLKLTSLMFLHQPDAKYMDYYERALYNDMLASIRPVDQGNTYHKAIYAGASKDSYSSTVPTGYTCCGGSAMEAHTKYVDSIYAHQGDDVLYVNLYIPSTLTWENGTVTQVNNFPSNDTLKLVVEGSGTFDMRLRVPYYATNGFIVKVNGVEQNISAVPSSYVSVSRQWTPGDVVEIQIPMDYHLWEAVDAPNIASIMYGPMVLAAQEEGRQSRYTRVTLDGSDLGNNIEANLSDFTFQIDAMSPNGDIAKRTLRPWYDYYTVEGTNNPPGPFGSSSSPYLDVTVE